MLPKNVINWFQIPTQDLARAAKFYSAILGNPVSVQDFNGQTMGFFPMDDLDHGNNVGGCLMSPMLGDAPSKVGTTVFLACDGQLDAVISRVVSAGGKILSPKVHLGNPGYMAVIEDTEGNRVGLHSWK
ncbi:MAG TPA: VOC family protein [Candidatus Paceibacterota bacterium]|jgi:predicted enzyme related to lactoylglutathione lyase|nr:VOC family protein [Candidatus Paceibacterota bacterium]